MDKPLTPEQVEQWQDFAIRMAKAVYSDSDRPSADWILSEVQSVIESINQDSPELVIAWETTLPYPNGHPDFGKDSSGRIRSPMFLCDLVSESVEDGVWGRIDQFATPKQRRELDRLFEQGEDGIDDYDELKEEIVDEWCGPVHCCLRSGIDLISGNVGVLGFTAGNIREIYPEGVPDWVKDEWDEFDSIPDDALVAL